MSSIKYTHAVVCRIPTTFKTADVSLNLEEAKKEHEVYVQTLRDLGLDVIELPPDDANPLSPFVEDIAVVCNGSALICKLGDPQREGEIQTIRAVLKKELELPLIEISDEKARLYGRDILFTGKEFFVGLSKYTNEGGARAVAAAFPEFPCTPVKVSDNQCLKSLVSVAGPDILCVSSSKQSQEVLKRIEREATFSYKTLTVPEEMAINVLYVNGTLIHRSEEEIPKSYQLFSERLVFQHKPLNYSEISKQKGLLSSCCLLLRRSRHFRSL
nr:PREDICTED: N(G),N(G)-dimethylarginine dimethylaminohydrolase 1 [Bemisia tabaci]